MLIYIHVPFCARRCSYCDFAIAVRARTPSRQFVEAVRTEWRWRQEWALWQESPRVETVYLGGGTPSRLGPEELRDLVQAIRDEREVVSDPEITLEANPDDVTEPRAAAWLEAGITRVSLGAQSFDPAVLSWMHRTHSVEQIGAAVAALRRAGFGNLSLDLIYGLPRELGHSWARDLECGLGLGPDHLSLYALTVEPRTPLGRWTTRGEVTPSPDDRVAEEFLLGHERLHRHGFEHYEVSNAARPGFRARHNAGYWRRDPFLGLGPSAHSGAGASRWWNVREWEAYRRAVVRGDDPRESGEDLTPAQVRLEALYLGLRTDAGVPQALLPSAVASRWTAEGWATQPPGRVQLTPEGWLRLDALVASLPDDF